MTRKMSLERKLGVIDDLMDIQNRMVEALDELKEIVRNMQDEHAEAYLIPQLEMSLTNEHDWVGRTFSLSDLIEELQNSLTPDEKDEQDDDEEEGR